MISRGTNVVLQFQFDYLFFPDIECGMSPSFWVLLQCWCIAFWYLYKSLQSYKAQRELFYSPKKTLLPSFRKCCVSSPHFSFVTYLDNHFLPRGSRVFWEGGLKETRAKNLIFQSKDDTKCCNNVR